MTTETNTTETNTTAPTKADTLTRIQLLTLLRAWVSKRPGFDPANYYGAPDAYRADSRMVTRQRNDAYAMLDQIEWRDSITADMIRAELRSARRLELNADGTLSYCTGQYYPTEYRAAVCSVCASLLWDYTRENAPQDIRDARDGSCVAYIRDKMRRTFGRGLASRWFR